MRIITRFHHSDIRRLLLGIIVIAGFVVLLVQCFGIPCRNSFCLSPIKVSVIELTNSNVTQVSVMNYTNLSDDDDEELENKKEDLDSENDVVISKEKVEMNVSFIAIGNISLRNPKMVVVSSESESDPNSVMIRVKDSRKGNVLSLRRHKQGSAISISQMNSLLIQSLSSFKSPVRILILEFSFLISRNHIRVEGYLYIIFVFFLGHSCRSLGGHLLETLKCSLRDPRLRKSLLFMIFLDLILWFIEISPSF